MANNLYNSMQSMNPFQQLIEEAKNFKQTFKGDPKEEVQRLLDSGQMTQAQLNQYSHIAQQIVQMMGHR